MKLYLSGPMRGHPRWNYPAFHDVAERLRSLGHEVYSPAEYWHEADAGHFPMRKAMADFCRRICLHTDAIVMLPEWERSEGACAELAIARVCGVAEYTPEQIEEMGHV